MTNNNCQAKEKLPVTVEDIKCFQCKKKFLTQNLFEWHSCFLKTRGNCSKCGQFYQKKALLFKHYVRCGGRFETPEAALNPELRFKKENPEFREPVNVSTTGEVETLRKTKGPKKKTVPQRNMPSIVKSELELETTEEDEYENYQEDITYDNFGNDSDSDGPSLEPEVQLQEHPVMRIKQECVIDPPAFQHSLPSEEPTGSELIRNIKKEKNASQAVVTKPAALSQQENKLKIKAERTGNEKAVIQVLNPLAVEAEQMAVHKKVFKIPQGLALKIKEEKKDAGYGDLMKQRDEDEPEENLNLLAKEASPIVNIKKEKLDPEERDEAEPEDEDLMPETPPVVKIKEEKMDAGYGDSNKPKQLINPMALIREKAAAASSAASLNGFPEKSLVISAVTSINPHSPSEPNIDNDGALTPTEISINALEKLETNNAEESSKVAQIPMEIVDNVKLPEPMDNGDELDELLKIYEDTAPSDSNELFQDLLKFD